MTDHSDVIKPIGNPPKDGVFWMRSSTTHRWYWCFADNGVLGRIDPKLIFPGFPDAWMSGTDSHKVFGWFKRPCPYCGALAECETVDIGVGITQATAYRCEECHASEIGPTAYASGEVKKLTGIEQACGWYKPDPELFTISEQEFRLNERTNQQ
jgi:hypothetical protein